MAAALKLTITAAGRAALVNANKNGTNAVLITQVGVTQTAFTPDPSMTKVPVELKRMSTLSGGASDPSTMHVTIRDNSTDSYSLYGLGLYLADGTLFAVYSQPTLISQKSAQAALLVAMDTKFADINANQLTFGDTNFQLNIATTQAPGVVTLSTVAEAIAGTDGSKAVTPQGLAGALDDRLGKGAPTTFGKTLLAMATAAALRTALAIKGAASYDPGAGNGLDSDLLDGQHGDFYRTWGNLIGVPDPVANVQASLDGKLNLSGGNMTGYLGHFFGNLATQQIYQGYGWKDGVARWRWVMESDGKFALYSYDAKGATAERALMVSSNSTGGRDLQFNGSTVWHGGNFDPNSKANTANPTFTGGLSALVGSTGRMRLMPLASGYAIESITPDGAAYAPFKIAATSIDLGSTNVTCGGWTAWHAQNFNPATKADLAGAAFTGAVSANGAITANNNALRAAGWGGLATDGVVYFGVGNSYMYKSGARFVFQSEQGNWSASLDTAGTIWTTGNFNPANYLPLNGGTMTGNFNLLNANIGIQNGNYKANLRADTTGFVGFINMAQNAWNWNVDDGGSTTQRGNSFVGGNQTVQASLGVGGAPSTKLDVWGPYGRILFHNGGSYNNIQSVNSANNLYVPLDFSASAYNFHGGNVTVDSAIIAGGGFQYSDRRLKRDIRPLAVERGLALRLAEAFAEWRRRSDGQRDVGIEAQKLRRIAPRYVIRGPERGNLAGLLAVDKAGAALEGTMDNALHLKEHEQVIHELLNRVKRLEEKA